MLKHICEVIVIVCAFTFELVGRIFHSIGSVCMSAAITLLSSITKNNDE